MIDWDGEKWEVYEKDGVRWDIDNFSDDDFEALNDALMTQNKIQQSRTHHHFN